MKTKKELNILFAEAILKWKRIEGVAGSNDVWEKPSGFRTPMRDFCEDENLVGMIFNTLRDLYYLPVLNGNSHDATCTLRNGSLYIAPYPGMVMVMAALEHVGIDTGVENDND